MTERKEISVTFSLTPEQVTQLGRVTILYNNISCTKGQNEITPEQLFENLMLLGSTPEITRKLSFFEQNFSANQPQNKTA